MAAAAAITGRLTDIRELDLHHIPTPGEDAPDSKLMEEQNGMHTAAPPLDWPITVALPPTGLSRRL